MAPQLFHFIHAFGMAHHDGSAPGIALDSFTKTTPPGWKPGVRTYPLKRYLQLLQLWSRQTECNEEAFGPTIAGRLRGIAFQFAMAVSRERLDLSLGIRRTMVGPELLSQASHVAWTDGAGNHHGKASNGGRVLIEAITVEYGVHDKDQAVASLDSYFKLTRANGTLESYITMSELTFEEARAQAGLELNAVGRSYFLLRGANISDRQIFDFKLRIDGDSSRYQDLRGILSRLADATDTAYQQTVPALSSQFHASGDHGSPWDDGDSDWWSASEWDNNDD